MKVYIAAPFERIALANQVADKLRRCGIEVTSRWLSEKPDAKLEDLNRMQIEAIIQQNDEDVVRADHVLAIAVHGLGGEMFAEVSLALGVNWSESTTAPLSAYRPGVVRYGSIQEGVDYLIRKNRENGK